MGIVVGRWATDYTQIGIVQDCAGYYQPPAPGRGDQLTLGQYSTFFEQKVRFSLTENVLPFQAGSIGSGFYSLKQLRCLFFNNRDDATARRKVCFAHLFRRFTSRIWRSQMNRRAVASSRLLKTIGRSPIQNA